MLEWLLMLVVCLGPVLGTARAYESGPSTMRRLADGGGAGGAIAGALMLVVLLAVLPLYAMSLRLFLLPIALGALGLAMGAATCSVAQLLRRAGL